MTHLKTHTGEKPNQCNQFLVQILSSTGLQQGDPIASLLYALTQQPILVKVAEEVPDLACHGWLLDDGSAVGDTEQLQKVADIVELEGRRRGLVLSTRATTAPSKTPKSTVWSPLHQDGDLDPLSRGIPRQGVLAPPYWALPLAIKSSLDKHCRQRWPKWER